MLLGTDIAAVLTTLTALDVDVIGLNCSTGPEDMRDAIRYLGENSPLPVHCIPNAGLPLQGPDGETIFPETPEQISSVLGEFVERHNVGIVGGCCGTTPDHIRAIAERVAGRTPGERPTRTPPLVSSMMTATDLVQEPRPTLVGERVNSQGSREAKELLLADDYDGLVQVAEDQVTGGAHVLDVCVALTERQDEDVQMREVVQRISLTQPAPIQIDSTEPEVIEAALEAIPGPRDRQLDQPRGRSRQGRPRDPARQGARRGADRADDRRDRDGEDRGAQARDREADHRDRLRRARPRPRGADLRRPHLHADDGRRRVEAVRDRDDRGDRGDQGGPARGQDLARRLERVVRRQPARARRPATRSSCTTASTPASTSRWSTRTTSRRTGRSPSPSASWPTTSSSTAARTPSSGSSTTSRRRGEDEPPRPRTRPPSMEPEEALHWHILRRKKDGVEDWIDRSVEKIGAGPDPEHGAAAGDEGGRRQVRRRRADPAVRAAVGRGDEARRRAARELPRQDRGPHEGQGRDRDRVRRRARHRQVAGQHDPDQQRLHGRRPGQAGPDRHDHRRRRRARRRRDRPLGAARLDLEADARLHPGAPSARARVPGADRRRRDQPRLRPPRPLPARQGVRRGLRARRLLLQGRLRRASTRSTR